MASHYYTTKASRCFFFLSDSGKVTNGGFIEAFSAEASCRDRWFLTTTTNKSAELRPKLKCTLKPSLYSRISKTVEIRQNRGIETQKRMALSYGCKRADTAASN